MKPPNDGWNRIGLMILLGVFSLLCLLFAPDVRATPGAHFVAAPAARPWPRAAALQNAAPADGAAAFFYGRTDPCLTEDCAP